MIAENCIEKTPDIFDLGPKLKFFLSQILVFKQASLPPYQQYLNLTKHFTKSIQTLSILKKDLARLF